jgi:hypothetical protein
MSTEKTTKKPGNFKKNRPALKRGKEGREEKEPGFAGPPLVLSKNPPAKPGAVTLPAP